MEDRFEMNVHHEAGVAENSISRVPRYTEIERTRAGIPLADEPRNFELGIKCQLAQGRQEFLCSQMPALFCCTKEVDLALRVLQVYTSNN